MITGTNSFLDGKKEDLSYTLKAGHIALAYMHICTDAKR